MNVRKNVGLYSSIYNPDVKSVFIENTYGHLSDKEILTNIRIFNQIGKIESFLGKDLYNFTLQNHVFLFEQFGWVNLGTFNVRKSVIESYVGWAAQNGKTEYRSLESIQLLRNKELKGTRLYTLSHFKNLDDLVSANISVVENEFKSLRIPEKRSFIMPETLTYLIWLRLNMDEISSLKMTDIQNNKIVLSDREIVMPDVISDKLHECIETDSFSYYVRMNITSKYYLSNEYVIRSILLKKMTANALRQLLFKYSSCSTDLPLTSDYYGKDFKYKNIYMSSFFSDFYQYEHDNNIDFKKISPGERASLLCGEFPNEDINLETVRDYFRWKTFYYGV